MIQFVFLKKGESQDPEFQKEYLKLADEEPTPVMPDEMEKLIGELARAKESSRFSKQNQRRIN